ncbi:acyl-CoA thioesterase II [Apiospora kogelbergensis]|uniref:acyl-CoA thioesterase II n=1 Tax=Apiospora kogelbergensis TaxID=1337665 RepID=UPI00312E0406
MPTLHQPPPIDPSRAPIEHQLLLTPMPLVAAPPGRSLFGGILIGASINAAQQTVGPDFYIHHMSCTFRAAPDATKPLFYRVARSSDRRYGAVREVKVEQAGVVFFSAECSFSLATERSSSISHQDKPPLQLNSQALKVPPPPPVADNNEKAFTEQMVLPGFLTWKGLKTTKDDIDPFVWRDYPPTPKQAEASSPSTSNVLYSWVRPRGNMSNLRTSHMAVLGCLTDVWVLSRLPEMVINPSSASGGPKIPNTSSEMPFMSTLNHTIWFHDPSVKLDDWLLVKKKSSWAGQGRCLVEQQFWDRHGNLMATCIQEGTFKAKQTKMADKTGQSKI